jgi:hypothetical protein
MEDPPQREIYLAVKVVCSLTDLVAQGILTRGSYIADEKSYEIMELFESMGESLPSRPEIFWVLGPLANDEGHREELTQVVYEYLHNPEEFEKRIEEIKNQMFPDPDEYEDEEIEGKPEDLC